MRSAVIVLVVILVVGWIWYDEQLDRRNEEVEVLRAQVESRVDDEADLRRQLDACAEVLRAARKVTRAQDSLVLGLYDDMSARIVEAYRLGQARDETEATGLLRLVIDEEGAFRATISVGDPAYSWAPDELVDACKG